MTAAVIYILYAISAGNLPDFTALGAYDSKDACVAAAHGVEKAAGTGENTKRLACVSSEALGRMATDSAVTSD